MIALGTIPFDLPSVRRQFQHVADDLLGSVNVVILLPEGIDTQSIRDQVSHRAIALHLREEWLDLRDVGTSAPGKAVGDRLRLQWPPGDVPRTTSTLIEGLRATSDLPDILYLEGFEELSDHQREDWLAFLVQWARVSHTLIDEHGKTVAFCLIVSAAALGSDMLSSRVQLAVYVWRGFPSVLELQMACRLADPDGGDGTSRWREATLSSLAGGDATVIESLWDAVCQGDGAIGTALRTLAHSRGWSAVLDGRRLSVLEQGRTSLDGHRELETACVDLWALGMAVETAEFGWEIHSGVLALLGKDDEIRHRLWRGQAPLVLPLVERARLALCDELSQMHGNDWPLRWATPNDSREADAVAHTPRAAEWGYLSFLLRTHSRELGISHTNWPRVARLAQRVRNTIAHYQPIPYAEFAELWSEIQDTSAITRASRFHSFPSIVGR